MKQVILSSFLKGRTGSSRSSELTPVVQLESDHTGTCAQVCGTPMPMLFLLYHVPLSRVLGFGRGRDSSKSLFYFLFYFLGKGTLG